jgi:bifunctional non-homologous end joining protein LigD
VPEQIKIGRRTVRISNPDKLMFPDLGISKRNLVDYYSAVAEVMLPEIKGHLLTLERFPNGIDGKRFYQKDMSDYFPDWIDRKTVPKQGGEVTHVVASEPAALAYLANQACVTLHMSLSRQDAVDYPNQMIFDLDPSSDDFGAIKSTALDLKDVLEELGLHSVVKTTGSRGLHVTIPLSRKDDFATVRAFARDLATHFAEQFPDRLTVEGRKEKRRGRIFVDWLRNSYGATAVAPFSVRARPGAPVAMPISWDEVKSARLTPSRYKMSNAVKVISKRDDPWKGWRRKARSLKEPARRLQRLGEAAS